MWTCDKNKIIINRDIFSLSLGYIKLERMLLSSFSCRGGKGKCHDHQPLKIPTYLEEGRIHETLSLMAKNTVPPYTWGEPQQGMLCLSAYHNQAGKNWGTISIRIPLGLGQGHGERPFWSTSIRGSFLLMGSTLRQYSQRTSPHPKLKMM